MESEDFWHLTSEKTVWGEKGGNFEEKTFRKPEKNQENQGKTKKKLEKPDFLIFFIYFFPPCLPPSEFTQEYPCLIERLICSTPRQFNKKLVNFGQSLDFLKFWEGNRGKQ